MSSASVWPVFCAGATLRPGRSDSQPLIEEKILLSRIAKLLISLVYAACMSFRRGLLRLLGRTPRATCVVLYYHSIPAERREAFAAQMEMLARLTTPVDLQGTPRLQPGRRYSAVTFDDGFEDAIQNAVPELLSRKIHSLFFVTSGFLGKPASWWPERDPESSRRIATAEAFQQLPSELVGIGAHTLTHPHLPTLDEETARREIVESRRALESLLRRAVETFSFPYGDFNEQVVSWCREAGYKRLFSTQHRNAFERSEEFVVGRVKAEPTDWKLEFQLKLAGGYLWLPRAIAWKRKLREAISLRKSKQAVLLAIKSSTASS
jgi:peptidoglycan/xylan/chitin deacetylase (PgdA/CDA1 family)